MVISVATAVPIRALLMKGVIGAYCGTFFGQLGAAAPALYEILDNDCTEIKGPEKITGQNIDAYHPSTYLYYIYLQS